MKSRSLLRSLLRSFPLAAMGLLTPAMVMAAESIVVEDRGGVSALPYYETLDSSPEDRAVPSAPQPIPRSLSEAEASLLPVRSLRLSPGDEPPRAIHAPGLTPIFLVGDDDLSRAWLARHTTELRELRAVGLVVDVSSPESLARLRRLVPDLTLSPASGDDLAERLGISHYPVRITATGIAP
jgi:integrating conjugative element protein (TIGR03765 family)